MIEVAVKKSFKNNKTFQYKINTSNDRIVLFGPSGSGKSNLIKMIAGFIDPDEGTIKINNNLYFKSNYKKLPVYKRRVGYLPQEYTLFPHMNVEENILYGAKIKKICVDRESLFEILNKLELTEKLNFYPHELSGGEKQRVAFARAIMVNPDILLFDEPFSSLDKVIREKLREIVVDIIDETGKKAIFVTHDFEDAFILGKEVFVVFNGKIIENGSADEIFNKPKFIQTARIINLKNIWEKEIFKNKFQISNIDSEFIGIKEENVSINPEQADFKTVAKVEKISNKGLFKEIKLNFNNLTIYSNQPVFKNIDLKLEDFVEIGINYRDLIFLNNLQE